MPTLGVTKAPDVKDPFPVTVAIEVKAGIPAHVGSPGPNKLNVIVPVGLLPPAMVAWSVTEAPTATDAEAVVVMVGDTFPAVTVTASFGSRQAVMGTAWLLVSPL